MIQDTSSMDRPVVGRAHAAHDASSSRSAVVAAADPRRVLFPSVRRWARAETRGRRDDAALRAPSRAAICCATSRVQGRVVASLHPTLFSSGQGIVSLRTKAGAQVQQRRRAGHDRLEGAAVRARTGARAAALDPRGARAAEDRRAADAAPRAAAGRPAHAAARSGEARSSTRNETHVQRRSEQQGRLRDRAGRRAHRADGARAGEERARPLARDARLRSRRRASSRCVSQQSVAARPAASASTS